ncbi:MAG: patatin-like phospholipase family protein [Egibacteraceae bacterium]
MKLGLVLSGGGAKGAFEAGVYAAVEDAGLQPQVLSGTSAGALNAAGIAAGMDAERLGAWWESVSDNDVYTQRRDVLRLLRPAELFGEGNLAERLLNAIGWTWLWDPSPLRRTLIAALGSEHVPVVADLVLTVSAVEWPAAACCGSRTERHRCSGPPTASASST